MTKALKLTAVLLFAIALGIAFVVVVGLYIPMTLGL
jgi:hypothetical protein